MSPTKAGVALSGWGQGACAGDYDNDGFVDLFVTFWGQNRLYHNRGDGTFADVSASAGLTSKLRWGAGCAFVDYDRDGLLDLFAANYIDFDPKSAPVPESGLCRYKGIPVACGPRVGRREERAVPQSRRRHVRRRLGSGGHYENDVDVRLGVSTLDFDDDGWTDVYVANDSNPSALYRNNHDGTFSDVGVEAGCAYSQDGKPQAGMGLALGDYDRNGTIDIFKTNFAGDTSTLYTNTGEGACEDHTFASGIGTNTRWLGWGVGFLDLDLDGWLDLFLVNGHVYPEVAQLRTEAGYKQRKVIYRNLRNGRFEDITERLGAPVVEPQAGRGAAFGDIDNDGDVDVAVNNVHDPPDLYRLDAAPGTSWTELVLVGTRSNRSAIGARVRIVAGDATLVREVRGGGSYFSQNDFRVQAGLGAAARIERVEVRWPNGGTEVWRDCTRSQDRDAGGRKGRCGQGAPRVRPSLLLPLSCKRL